METPLRLVFITRGVSERQVRDLFNSVRALAGGSGVTQSSLRLAHLRRHGWRAQAFLALGKRPESLFQAQMLFAGLGRAAHAGEAMVFGGHRAIFGGIHHRVLPRAPVPPAAPEERAWG
jgi:hypothetical protein